MSPLFFLVLLPNSTGFAWTVVYHREKSKTKVFGNDTKIYGNVVKVVRSVYINHAKHMRGGESHLQIAGLESV